MTDLLPCPFCGSTDVTIEEDYYLFGSCDDCGAKGPAFEPERTAIDGRAMHVYDTNAAEAKAAEAWNRRAEPPPLTIEAGSMQIGSLDGLHVSYTSDGLRIYNGDKLVWP